MILKWFEQRSLC